LGKLFVVIDTTCRPLVIISPAHLQEALRIDGKILDEHSFFPNAIAEKYTFGGYGAPISIRGQHMVCLRGLTRAMHKLAPEIKDETQEAVRKCFGTKSDWQNIQLVKECKALTGQITSRMLVGRPLCRFNPHVVSLNIVFHISNNQ
jgi:hypothetical protein